MRNREEVAEVLRRAAHQKQQYTDKLAEQKEWAEARLVREVARTDELEAEMATMKTQFAAQLTRLEGLQDASAAERSAESAAVKLSLGVRTPGGALPVHLTC